MAEKYQSREERRKQMQANQHKKKRKKPKNKFLTFIKRLILVCFLVGLAGVIAGISTFAYYASSSPKLTKKQLSDPIPSVIKDKSNKTVATLGAQNRKYIDYEELPKQMENAILSTEDARFYQHHGIDPIRLGGAVVANFTKGFGSEGASTLTQQVVSMALNNKNEKTLKRKAQEAWLAIQLERKYTKHEILEMYVNKVYMSDGVFGFETAAEHYYGKSLSKLSLPEIAVLAGMPQSPNNYNPFDHPDLTKKRRDIVLSMMYKNNKITKAEMEKAQATPVSAGLVKEKERNTNANKYPAFVNEVIKEVQKLGNYNVYADGLTIYTTLDSSAQQYTEKILNTNSIINYPDKKMQAGIALIDTKTGEIRALGGGRNMRLDRGFNYAVDTKRSPGSTIKPILDYGPAIEYLHWSTGHQLNDVATTYSDGTPINDWDNRFLGKMSMRKALYLSRNIPAYETYKEVGKERAIRFAKKLGLDLNSKEIVESSSIGGGVQVSPLQMASAYAAFGNEGIYNKPHAIRKIVLRDGVTEIKPHVQSKIAMSDFTAYMITDVLKDVLTKGTGTTAHIPGLPAAGKTGTTNFDKDELAKYGILSSSVRDSWFAGYTTRYSLAVWTGYESEKGKKYGVTRPYQTVAQQIYRHLMRYVSEGKETPDFTMPKSVVRMGSELYIRGHIDTAIDKKSVTQDAPANVHAAYDANSKKITVTWDYEGSGATFNVSGTINGSAASFGSTSGKSITVANPKAGATYVFNVTATVNGVKSKAASASVTVPGDSTDTKADDNQNKQPEDNAQKQPDANNSNTNSNTGTDTNQSGENKDNTGSDKGTNSGNSNGTGSENSGNGNSNKDNNNGPGNSSGTGPSSGNDRPANNGAGTHGKGNSGSNGNQGTNTNGGNSSNKGENSSGNTSANNNTGSE